MPTLNKDTTLCISLAARPSNNGTLFHNHLYDQLGMNWIYKAFAPADLAQAVAGIRGLGIRGAAVSMPYKEAVIPLIDHLAPSAAAIGSVNTIVNDNGVLTAHNTDYSAVVELLRTHSVSPALRTVVRGSGGMAKAVVAALAHSGFGDVVVVARNESAGRNVAETYGFTWASETADGAQLLVNATPIGMAGGKESHMLPFSLDQVEAAQVVFDVVAVPVATPLTSAARAAGKRVVTGTDVATLQAVEQFVLYTGVTPTAEQIRAAREFMLASTQSA
ncbi:shikimate 5-dehydrogenase [Arthrobacter sp. AQ5-05]|uniref:shikimate 5-dehydrogenase n=1 Tax=Arthrobacter sp. AQ5-05 TaxID=2184581 RepID=UPI000DCC8DB6|nr:shikimate 5-dehydrogenase [Arthrobacter sp. AQ5-05]RAX48932.1 shikimate 5-dehydrogenase [Arthrobacter sp. AQ5-05]